MVPSISAAAWAMGWFLAGRAEITAICVNEQNGSTDRKSGHSTVTFLAILNQDLYSENEHDEHHCCN